jgi:AcrR family transcriptional regulator
MAKATADPRILRSRRTLETSLLTLIEQQDLTTLSIADVTREAGLSRSTFYDHYADLHALAESACTEMFEALLAEAPVFALVDGPGNPLDALFDHVLSHRRLYSALLGTDGSARVMVYLQRRMTVAIHVNRTLSQRKSGTHRDHPSEAPLDVVASFAAGALLGVLIDWLGRACPGDPKSMAAETWALMAAVVTE